MPSISSLTARSLSTWQVAGLLFIGFLGCAAIVFLLIRGEGRAVIAATALSTFVMMAMLDVRLAIPAVFVYLIALGDLRRLILPYYDWSGADPMLLVGGVFALLVFASALVQKDIKFDTPLAKWVLALMGIMALQILNPKQGGLMVGMAGALFIVVPIFWFWVGRTYATPDLLRTILFKIVLPLAVIAAAYGTYQVFYGYLPHQRLWYDVAGYAGLGSPDNPSPISLFASNTEYVSFLGVATVVAWAAVLKGHRPALLLVFGFLFALLITGIRGGIFFPLIMMAGLWAVLSRSKAAWIVRGAFALVLAGAGLVWVLTQATQAGLDETVPGIDRQAQEFVDARTGKEEHSSIVVHTRMMLDGYTFALREPLGIGLGATTKAAGRFGGRSHSTETPFGNSFVSLGLPGGIIYHIVVFLVIITAFRLWLRTRSLLALCLLGILGVSMVNLMAGGMYAVGPLIAFSAGALDRLAQDANVYETRRAG